MSHTRRPATAGRRQFSARPAVTPVERWLRMSRSSLSARLGRALAVALPLAALPLVARGGDGPGTVVLLAAVGLVVGGGAAPWAGCVRISRQIPHRDDAPAARPTRAGVRLARARRASEDLAHAHRAREDLAARPTDRP